MLQTAGAGGDVKVLLALKHRRPGELLNCCGVWRTSLTRNVSPCPTAPPSRWLLMP